VQQHSRVFSGGTHEFWIGISAQWPNSSLAELLPEYPTPPLTCVLVLALQARIRFPAHIMGGDPPYPRPFEPFDRAIFR
jgi:hypothetical protein